MRPDPGFSVFQDGTSLVSAGLRASDRLAADLPHPDRPRTIPKGANQFAASFQFIRPGIAAHDALAAFAFWGVAFPNQHKTFHGILRPSSADSIRERLRSPCWRHPPEISGALVHPGTRCAPAHLKSCFETKSLGKLIKMGKLEISRLETVWGFPRLAAGNGQTGWERRVPSASLPVWPACPDQP